MHPSLSLSTRTPDLVYNFYIDHIFKTVFQLRGYHREWELEKHETTFYFPAFLKELLSLFRVTLYYARGMPESQRYPFKTESGQYSGRYRRVF